MPRTARCALPLLLLLLAANAPAPAAAQSCRLPPDTIAPGGAPPTRFAAGDEICIRQAGPDCFGCESGYVHTCRDGAWRPVRDLPCDLLDEGSRDRARDAALPRLAPRDITAFRRCRHFDADGHELRLPDIEVQRARQAGLIDHSRCETVYCRLFDRSGRPVAYEPDEAWRIEDDLREGRIALRASDCRAARPGFADGWR